MVKSTEPVVTIYGLADPRTGIIRYVGQTVMAPEVRLKGHLSEATPNFRNLPSLNPKQVWISELVELGMEPAIVILARTSPVEADEVERRLMRQCNETHQILNTYAMDHHGIYLMGRNRANRIRSSQHRAAHGPRSFADRLVVARESEGFSQQDLATRSGVSVGTVSRLECQRGGPPSAETLRKLKAALGESAYWIEPAKRPTQPDGSRGDEGA